VLHQHIVSHVLGSYLGLNHRLVFHLEADVLSLTFQNEVDGCCRWNWGRHLASWSKHLAWGLAYLRHERCFGGEKVVVLRIVTSCFLIACYLLMIFAAYATVRAGVF